MCVLGYVCTEHSDTKLSIIFLPFFTFPASTVSLQGNILIYREILVNFSKAKEPKQQCQYSSKVYHCTKYYEGHSLTSKVHIATVLV